MNIHKYTNISTSITRKLKQFSYEFCENLISAIITSFRQILLEAKDQAEEIVAMTGDTNKS